MSFECLTSVELDEHSIIKRSAEVEHERAVAIPDLLESNVFSPRNLHKGPYHLRVSVADNRLHFNIFSANRQQEEHAELAHFVLSLTPFRSLIRDYFLVCESYFEAVKQGRVSHIEAIDMGRRSIHNEGSQLLATLLSEKALIDFETARRLFTLVCVLHIKG